MSSQPSPGIPDDLLDAAGEACSLLKALANLDRLLVLCHLADGERNVSQLQEVLGLRQPTLSQQLAKLRLAGLVSTRRDGKEIYYSVASPEASRLIALLYEMYCPQPPGRDAVRPPSTSRGTTRSRPTA